jgi:rhamnosyltransferase
MSGWKIAYSGDAMCRHSHNYSIKEEFNWHFDLGVFHAREPWIRRAFGEFEGEGMKFVKSELGFLGLSRFYLWPGALLLSAAKLLGYRLGQKEERIPIKHKRRLGMYKRYWDGSFSTARSDHHAAHRSESGL